MAAKGVLSMDSYRLAQYAVQVPCYICEGGNSFDSELCWHCHAPLVLAHQAKSAKVAPRMIAALGASGSGKTVYLGMLTDMLSHPRQPLQLTSRGAFSITLQQNTVAALQQCRFPEKTPTEPDRWNWVHCQVKQQKKNAQPVELIMPDVAGEALAEEIDHPGSFPVIQAFLGKCHGLFILADASRMAEGNKDQDFFGMKMLSYLSEMQENSRLGWSSKPIAVILSKADECESCFEDPHTFTREHSPGIWHQCEEHFSNYKMFATGVAGACAYRQHSHGSRLRVPLRVEPRGIIEPFEWLVQKLN